MQTITLNNALDILQDGNYHSVGYVTANQDKKTGGEIVRIKECKIINHVNNPANGGNPTNVVIYKPQNHGKHATRNLSLSNGIIRKIHIFLLFKLDNYSIV
jgi:hypothetical protein